jgi:hypothetical protein
MITVVAHDTAAAGAADVVRGLLARHAAASRSEHQGAFAEHRRRPHFRRNVEADLVALLTAQSRTLFRPALCRHRRRAHPSQ